jgi:hypothetical protein
VVIAKKTKTHREETKRKGKEVTKEVRKTKVIRHSKLM